MSGELGNLVKNFNSLSPGHSFIRKDEHGIIAATDRFAIAPVFFAELPGGRLALSESIDAIRAHLENPTLDPKGYFDCAISNMHSRQTPFKGVKRLMPGEYLLHWGGKTHIGRYWSFAELGGQIEWSFEEACEQLLHLVERGVQKCAAVSHASGVHVSGGIDSAAVAGLLCSQRAGPVDGFFLKYSHKSPTEPGFEDEYVERLGNLFPDLKVHPVVLSGLTAKIIDRPENWWGLTEEDHVLQSSRMAAALGIDNMLTGLGGDQLASYRGHARPAGLGVASDLQARLLHYRVRAAKKLRQVVGYALRDDDRKSELEAIGVSLPLSFAQFLNRDFIREVKNVRGDFNLAPDLLPAEMSYRRLLLDRCNFTKRAQMWHFLGQRSGVTFAHPLLDSDLVDFCATVPPRLFMGANREPRGLFREVMSRRLAPTLFDRAFKPAFLPDEKYHVATIRNFRATLLDLIGTKAEEVFDLPALVRLADAALGRGIGTQIGVPGFGAAVGHILQFYVTKSIYLNRYF